MTRIVLLLITVFSTFSFAEQHGLWIVRNTVTSPNDLQILQKLHRVFALTDLYVQVRALGENQLAMVKNRSNKMGIKEIGQFCRQNDIRLHAWLNVFYIWNNDELPSEQHTLSADSDYLMEDYHDGPVTLKTLKKLGIEGYFVDPNAPENLRQLKSLIKMLISQYHVDGIHFDYFRYPAKPVHFSRNLRSRFLMNEYVDPAKIRQNQTLFLQAWGWENYASLQKQYDEFLERILAARLSNLYQYIKTLDANCKVSVAVKPNLVIARKEYAQNWLQWLENGDCDYVVLMNYSPDYEEFKKNLNVATSYKEDDHIINGIGVYYLDKKQLIQRLKDVQISKLDGYCLFSFTTFKEQPDLIPDRLHSLNSEDEWTQGKEKQWGK